MAEYDRLESELQNLSDEVHATKLHVEAIDATARALSAGQRDMFCRVQIAEKTCNACRANTDKLSELCAKHTRTLEYLQFKQRTKNLIVHNVKEAYLQSYNNIADGILHLFNSHGIALGDDTIESASRIGNGTAPNQPVRVTFVSAKFKRAVFRGVKNLRGLGVSVANDLSKEQREQRKILNLYRKRLNEMGKRTYLRDTKLIHENVVYNVHTLPRLLHDINVDPDNFSHLQVATKVNGAVIYITLDEALRQPIYLADCEIVRSSEQIRGGRTERKPLRLVDPAEQEQLQQEQQQQQQNEAAGQENEAAAERQQEQKDGTETAAENEAEVVAAAAEVDPVAGPSGECSAKQQQEKEHQDAESDSDDDDDNDSVKSCNVTYDPSSIVHRSPGSVATSATTTTGCGDDGFETAESGSDGEKSRVEADDEENEGGDASSSSAAPKAEDR